MACICSHMFLAWHESAPKGIAIGSSVFAGLTVVTNTYTQADSQFSDAALFTQNFTSM